MKAPFFVIMGLLCLSASRDLGEQTQSPPHVLKISAGPSGAEAKGTFVLSEERSTFSRTTDREVIVVFQWEGVPGPHKLEARWRSPDGGFTSTSVIDYVASARRFGAYWSMAIAPTMQLGTWSIEATVDGQPSGRFSFEITDALVAAGVPSKRPWTQQELYEALRRSYVQLSRVTSDGREMEPVGGVLAQPGQVLTGVQGIDAVGQLTAVFPDGRTAVVASVTALNRSAGWALLPSDPDAGAAARAVSDPPKVGDRCYSMQASTGGSRVLLEGQITGLAGGPATPTSGWMASFFNGLGTSGAPVMNEYGELLGILSGPPRPEVQRLRDVASADFGNTPVLPLSAIPPPPYPAPASLDDLRARGQLLAPLHGDAHVLSGGFAPAIVRGPTVRPQDQREEFSVREKELVVFVTWAPRTPLKGQTSFHFFDAHNRVVASSKNAKVNLRKNDLVLSSAKVPVFQQPGTYRVEIHLDGKPAWRGYVRITP